jgi:hypothetical protein
MADDATASEAAALFERIAPELANHEAAVRSAVPGLSDDEVRDWALRRALAQLRFEVSQQTFAYLPWAVGQAVAAVAATSEAVAATVSQVRVDRADRLASQEARSGAGPESSRTFVDVERRRWSVREVATGDPAWARAPQCLLFSSQEAVRRVWHYPEHWRELADKELEALSWRT